MSRPWEPPSRDPDGEWPAEDAEARPSRPSAQPPEDPWGSSDLWPETSRDTSPAWDEWPTEPAPDDYLVEEPPPPVLSDPWAESWSDEAPMSPAPRDAWSEPSARSEPAVARAAELEPSSAEALPPAEPPLPVEITPPAPAALRPWPPDADPWETSVDPVVETPAVAEAGTEPPAPTEAPEPDAEPMRADSDPTDASSEPSVAGAFRGLGRAARSVLPDWLAEPITHRQPDRQQPEATAPADEPAPDAAPPVAEEPAAASVAAGQEREPELDAPSQPEPEPEPAAAPVDEPTGTESEDGTRPGAADSSPAEDAEPIEAPADRPWWRSVSPWGTPATSGEPADPDAVPEAIDLPAPEPPDEPVSVASVPPEPVTEWPAEDPTPAQRTDDPAEPEAPVTASWTARPAASEPQHDDVPSADVVPEASPGRNVAAKEDRWDDPKRPAAESTQVLPTSWAAPVPDARPAADPSTPLAPVGGDIRTRLRAAEARSADIEADDDGEPEPTTAEQAVPWLIGFILLLAGMVIVLLALIFAGDESLGAGGPSPTPSARIGLVSETASASPSATAEGSPSASASASAMASDRPETPAPSAEPTPTPLAIPEYGPLEIIYQGRSAALAPIYLLHREFTVEADPDVLAQDPSLDVRRFAWAPDGTVGVGLYADVLVSVEIGTEKRRLGDGLSTVTFGDDAETVYAVRVTQDGANDVATVLAIDFRSADMREVASVSYPRPDVAVAESLTEAQFADDGGPVRLYWMEDDVLRLWVIGGGAWHITPDDGDVTEVDDVAPVLWAPDGDSRIVVEDGAQSTLRLQDAEDQVTASTTVGGLVSHLRWSPSGDRVVFTLARSAAGGGILQDLFLWDLADGAAPTQLTATGAAFGAEWRGSQPRWDAG